MASTTFRRPVIRLLIGLIIMGAVLTFFGASDFFKDIGGSHADFAELDPGSFREGDIVGGTIRENLGCCATVTTTRKAFGFIETSKRVSSGYYIIPYFDSLEDAVPTRIIVYKTGNTKQMKDLDKLEEETDNYYIGNSMSTHTTISVARAEVHRMTQKERGYLEEYLNKYVEWLFGHKYRDLTDLKAMYKTAIIPYVVQYHEDTSTLLVPLGLGLLAVAGIIIFVISRGRSGAARTQLNYIPPVGSQPYVSQQPGSGLPQQMQTPQYQRPGVPPAPPVQGTGTGMAGNAGMPPQMQEILSYQRRTTPDDKFREALPPGMRSMYTQVNGNKSIGSAQPPIPAPVRRDTAAVFYGKKNYSDMERPMPPLEGEQGAGSTWQPRGIGQPNIYGSSVPPFVPPGRRQDKGDSMPTVDPHSEEHIDLSNGGVAPEERSVAGSRAQMPMNGSLPVINPESHDTVFDREIGSQMPEMPKAPEMPKVNAADSSMEVKPLELKDRYSTEQFRVEVSENYQHLQKYVEAGSGQMQSVDPYTEKNVDLSNGGRELLDDVPERPRAPEAPASPKPAKISLEKHEKLPDFTDAAPAVQDVSAAFAEIPKVQDIPTSFTEIPKVQDTPASFTEIPKVQDIPTVQDVPKAADFPTVPDYSANYERPEFPTSPGFPDKIETPAFPKAPEFPEKDESGNYTF